MHFISTVTVQMQYQKYPELLSPKSRKWLTYGWVFNGFYSKKMDSFQLFNLVILPECL